MRIRRFKAASMAQALEAVRRALGPDAVILETRPVLGAGSGGRGVEVLAAADRHPGTAWDAPLPQAPPSRPPRPPLPAERGPAADRDFPRPVPRPRPIVARAASAAAAEDAPSETERLRRRLTHLSRLVASEHFSRLPAALRDLYGDLVSAELDANLAFGLVALLADQAPLSIDGEVDLAPLRLRLRNLLGDPPPTAGPLAASHLLFGPPGAGKTTVAAALAEWALRENGRPALVSFDTLRAGGAAALEHYARILGVPFLAAFSPAEIRHESLTRLAGCAPLIVDTPGVTRADCETIDDLRAIAATPAGGAVHLVLPATGKSADLAACFHWARRLRCGSLIFTRMDETSSYGGVLSLSLKSHLPVSFLNWGRDIATCLRPCSPEDLVTLALEPPAGAGAGPHGERESAMGGRAHATLSEEAV